MTFLVQRFSTTALSASNKMIEVGTGSILSFDFCSSTLENCIVTVNSAVCVLAGSYQPKLALHPQFFSSSQYTGLHMCVQCSSPRHSLLLLQASGTAYVQAQCFSLPQALLLHTRLKLSRNPEFTLGTPQPPSESRRVRAKTMGS